jgi:hypothetical protein
MSCWTESFEQSELLRVYVISDEIAELLRVHHGALRQLAL